VVFIPPGPEDFGPNPLGLTVDKGRSSADVHWRIDTVEPKNSPWKRSNFSVKGQLPLPEDGLKYNVTNVIADAGGLGLRHPFVQWIRGEKQTVTFEAHLFAEHNGMDIKTLFNSILRTMTFVPELNRPPVCRFTYGNILSLLVLVQGGEAQIKRARKDGKARYIVWPLTLVRFVPYKLKILSTSGIKESRHELATEERRMYEVLAAREYGTENALFGDRLRKRNRGFPFAAEDESAVKVPSGDIILTEIVEPEFHGFKVGDTPAQQAMLKRITNRAGRFLVASRR
jgi:hypothetical protein